MAWYYITRMPGRDAKSFPPVKIKSAKAHLNAVREPRSGATVYGWIEVYEPLDEEMVREYGLIEGSGEDARA